MVGIADHVQRPRRSAQRRVGFALEVAVPRQCLDEAIECGLDARTVDLEQTGVVAAAGQRAQELGVSDRVRFERDDAAGPSTATTSRKSPR